MLARTARRDANRGPIRLEGHTSIASNASRQSNANSATVLPATASPGITTHGTNEASSSSTTVTSEENRATMSPSEFRA